MPTLALNGRTAPGLSCPSDKNEIVYWSDELVGFGLRCRAGGARAWFVQYRTKTGEARKHTLGDPASVPFAKAHKEAARLLAAAKLGGDPAGEAKKRRMEIRLGELVERYLANQKPRMRARSFEELSRHLTVHAKPLHGQAAARVTQRALAELFQGLASRAPVTANRVRASLSAMFAWGMKSGLVVANPVAATFKPAEEKSRERVLSDAELALIWRCTDSTADHDRIVRLLMLTGARREEIAGMRWCELAPSDGGAVWTLPSERSKNGLPHVLALPPMIVELLPRPRETADGEARELLFGEGDGPFSGWSRCKERLDDRIAKANGDKPIPPWVLHDLRRTCVTRLNDLDIEPHVIEALVNHIGGLARAGVAGTYNRSAYAAQKRAAVIRWCDHIARLTGGVGGGDGAKVVSFRRAG
jgi:integrase